jgi:thiosulfate reductase cytochrome b subunit
LIPFRGAGQYIILVRSLFEPFYDRHKWPHVIVVAQFDYDKYGFDLRVRKYVRFSGRMNLIAGTVFSLHIIWAYAIVLDLLKFVVLLMLNGHFRREIHLIDTSSNLMRTHDFSQTER